MNQNLDIFSFEFNGFIKYKSFKRIGQSIGGDIEMLKSLFFIHRNRRAVGKIVG